MTSAQTNVSQPQSDAAAETSPALDQHSWLDLLWNLPIFNWFAPPTAEPGTPAQIAAVPAPALPPCAIAPLPSITDPQASVFNSGESLDTSHLSSGMSVALVRFQTIVNKLGGSLELKSAYRPPAYQQHLQQVWDGWMELRNNDDASCHDLRATVQHEFLRHHLLETQRPVNSSDHTRGLAFDATVTLPRSAKLRKRKVTLDAVARMAGLRRPDILHDPVHFKFVGGKSARG